MQIAETIFHILTLLVLVAMAARYGLARGIHGYHKDAMGASADPEAPGVTLVFRALYLAIGFGTLAVALGYAVLVFRVTPDLGYGTGYAFVMASVLAVPMLAVTWRVERMSGVKTPWRVILAGTVLAVIAYALSLIG
ncbi:hypothetical protein [Maritimibacter sp. UBA3975]|uniref:hypothetical protein n=1 Tax=Maritimibacter sp. UBA3975 TaxID=1946833 RepID=UPI000C0B3DBD|nr:hypothetical protein [Maritimibacter sp. UBA3975]MAM62476.1 hypothetical protein [Maritimibacter sp.]|tara:strand:- start:16542 stop:16952 length:411 start_codon:yes stop_codon:yes gene_type:complete